jgi:hypothetical protein
MKLLASTANLLRLLFFAAACAILVLFSLLLWVERSGWLKTVIASQLADRISTSEQEISLDGARLHCLRPSIELRGLSLGPDGRILKAEHLELGFGVLPGGGLGLTRVEARDGHVRLGQGLLEVVQGLRRGKRQEGTLDLPRVELRKIALELSHPEIGDIPLGLADVRLLREPSGTTAVQGRIQPALADDPKSSYVHISGELLERNLVGFRISSDAIQLNPEALPPSTALEFLRTYAGKGELSVQAQGTFSLDGSAATRTTAMIRLTDGSFQPPTTDRTVGDIAVQVELRCDTEPLDLSAWDATLAFACNWNGSPLRGGAVFGEGAPRGHRASAWMRAERVQLEPRTLEALNLNSSHRVWQGLNPRGEATLCVGARLPEESGARPQLAQLLTLGGSAGMTYTGWERNRSIGFPIPIEGIRGSFLAFFHPDGDRLAQVGWLGVHGQHHGGSISSRGTLAWFSRARNKAVYDIFLETPRLPVDERLRVALDSIHPARWVWSELSPSAGDASVTGRIVRNAPTAHTVAQFDIEFQQAAMRWKGLPLSLRELSGELGLTLVIGLGNAFRVNLEGKLPTADRVTLAGRFQDDPWAVPRNGGASSNRRIEVIELEAENLSLRGADRDVLVATYGGVGAALEHFNPSGKADVSFHSARAPYGPMIYTVEVTPREARLLPPAFPIPTSAVRGRVLVNGTRFQTRLNPEDGAFKHQETTTTRIAPMLGEWTGGVSIGLTGAFESRGEGDAPSWMTLHGAGIDPSNRNLMGALARALSRGEDGRDFDLSAFRIDGRLDATAELRFGGEADGSRYWTHLRDNSFSVSGPQGHGEEFELRGLRGTFRMEDDLLSGGEISGLLGSTPVVLRNPRFFTKEGNLRVETALQAEIPIDREHLRFFMGEETITALLERTKWRGLIEIDGALLRLHETPTGRGRVELSGRVVPSSMFVRFGVPISIQSAVVDIQKLSFEEGHVRAWARVEDLYGQIAGRQLKQARTTISYVQPRLTILDLAGDLEGGRISDLNQGDSYTSSAFSIELRDPFPFEAALRLEDVPFEGLLQGVFESDTGNRGQISSELRLAGTLDRLSTLRGSGHIALRNSRLWSIPVIKDMLGVFRLDGTAVFENLRSSFQLKNGLIHLRELQAESSIMQLVGEGSLGLDGSLSQELKPRLSLVEQVAPLKQLGRAFQDNLLTLKIGGDMSRPIVIKNTFVHQVFSFIGIRRSSEGRRDLPIPPFSPLPLRF